MKQEAARIEQDYKGKSKPRSASPSFTGFLALIGRMLFYMPIWTEENQQHHNVRFIYVHFSAWHFAGSDLLWAGIAIRLFHAMQMSFGKLQLVLYRVVQYDEEDEVKKKVCELNSFSSSTDLLVALCGFTKVQLCFELNACLHAHNDNVCMLMSSRLFIMLTILV